MQAAQPPPQQGFREPVTRRLVAIPVAIPEARQVDVNQNSEGRKGQELVDEPRERRSLMARSMAKYMYARQSLLTPSFEEQTEGSEIIEEEREDK
jgi:hypothetical protein